ncbi:hypothetical protein [Phaeobacter italicus]|uniref:hypothetical protein n=1 Tax=Phaeobacter italicus TaxID=481446 RepID=UPI001C961E9E|nr:hypothetical protein [Phaeobacter italicus]MBY6043110.1 hypothetical protein [Phaeobacter italicus]
MLKETGYGKYGKELSSLKAKVFRVGPIFQNLGLTTELTFKTALLLSGRTKDQVKCLGHDLVALQTQVRTVRDLKAVEKAAFEAASIIEPPSGMLERLESSGQEPLTWFNFATHIRSLNSNYNSYERPDGRRSVEKFRSRYPSTDHLFKEVCVEAVMAGLDVLLSELQAELSVGLTYR